MEGRFLLEALRPGLLQAAPRAPEPPHRCPLLHHVAVFSLHACLCPDPPFIRTQSWSRTHPHDLDFTCSFAKTLSPAKATFTFTGTGVGRQFNPQHKPANSSALWRHSAALGGERCPPGPCISGSPPLLGTSGALLASLASAPRPLFCPTANLTGCLEAPWPDTLLSRHPCATFTSGSLGFSILSPWLGRRVSVQHLPTLYPGTPSKPRACSPVRVSTRLSFKPRASPHLPSPPHTSDCKPARMEVPLLPAASLAACLGLESLSGTGMDQAPFSGCKAARIQRAWGDPTD